MTKVATSCEHGICHSLKILHPHPNHHPGSLELVADVRITSRLTPFSIGIHRVSPRNHQIHPLTTTTLLGHR